MGRKEKILGERIVNEETIDKRKIGYYSTPDFVCSYIARKVIKINNKGKSVFDPCCGREEMLFPFNNFNVRTYGVDIIKYKEKYNCSFENRDFIELYCSYINKNGDLNVGNRDSFKPNNNGKLNYDYYVLNPPYNCHEVEYIKYNKKNLKRYFNEVGIHNMYGMFISAIIDLAKEGAIMGIITSDSFFTSKSYTGFRKKILRTCTIHEITMCPTDLFLDEGADVRTSILILQKGTNFQGNITVNNRCSNKEELIKLLSLGGDKQDSISQNKESLIKVNNEYSIKDIILNGEEDNNEFVIECPGEIKALFNNNRLSEKFKCITGISTGNDKLYLSKEMKDPYTIPFYKNPGKDRFYTDRIMYINKNFMNISKEVPNFMVRNKDLVYKSGIVCSSMGVQFSASRLPKDSTFGVNSCIICNDEDVFWLLAYLNSTLVTYLVRGVLIRSNMITSGYVSRIPLLNFDNETREKLRGLGKMAYEIARKKVEDHCLEYVESKENEYAKKLIFKRDINKVLLKIDNIINNYANLCEENILYINKFKSDLVRRT